MPDALPLPVIRSIPAVEPLVNVIQAHYGLTIINCQLIKALVLDTYRLTTLDGFYIFRLYRAGQRSYDEILSELEMLGYLRENGLLVSTGIKNIQGGWVIPFSMPEGIRYGALFTYSPGEPLSKHLTPPTVQAFGQMLAKTNANISPTSNPLRRASDRYLMFSPSPHPLTVFATATPERSMCMLMKKASWSFSILTSAALAGASMILPSP
jgi:Ser/Thr protein kinase RdoA (MazF antagonist)